MSEISYKKYWTEIDDLAQNIKEEAEEYDRDIQEVLWETIDGHQWVIYTWANPYVLAHSSNEDAYFEEVGEPIDKQSYGEVMMLLAFYAMVADVSERLYRD